jgi:glutaconate CoA-transferase subunit A
MTTKVVPESDALKLVPDGSAVGVGGILMTRKPVALLDALGRAGRRDLTLYTLLGSLDAEILAVHGALARAVSIYTGFEQFGGPPVYDAAVGAGAVEAVDYNEIAFLSGLRAGVAGLPFLPTRGGRGSDVTTQLGMRTVTCPYTGEQLIAVPAIRPDVTLLHAEAADEHGNVLGPAEPAFLFDFDAIIARAAARVVVSVERIADAAEMTRRRDQVLLFSHEVDAVVVAPGGARPTALPGAYRAELGRLSAYLEAARAGDPRAALDTLVQP